MKKSVKLIGLTFCVVCIACAGNVLATPAEDTLDEGNEQTGRPTEKAAEDKDCHLFLLTRGFSLKEASMEAGAPINTLHLFMTGPDGKIIKNAQVITTMIDRYGNQQSRRVLPFKGGYMMALDHLPAGPYLVETEIITKGRLLTEEFRINKA